MSVPQIALMLRLGVSHDWFLATSGLVIVGLILPAAVGFGLVFPAVVDRLCRTGRRAGASVGAAYVVNTVGTTLGAIAAGFWLIPALGTQRTLEIGVLACAAAYVLTWFGGGPDSSRIDAAWRFALPAAALAVVLLPRWDWAFAHAQYSKDPLTFLPRRQDGTLEPWLARHEFVFLREATEATVSVARYDGESHILYVNGKPDASNTAGDMVAQRLLGVLPVLFHENPRTALVIGLGSGTTAGTLSAFPFERIDVAEISPEVDEAARTYFSRVNNRLHDDPRVAIHLDDGRSFLHFQPEASYDVIVSEPSNPWMAGVSGLFTNEFFADARRKLRPGGVVCQWFHYYNMSIDHIRLLARTFHRQFPEAAMFVVRGGGPTGDIIMVGSRSPLRLRRLPDDPDLPPELRSALAGIQNATTQAIASGLVVPTAAFADFAGAGPLNTDNRPILEFEAPADRFSADFLGSLRELLSVTPRAYLPAGPAENESSALAQVSFDGFALPLGPPPGEETSRGITVLSFLRPGGEDLARWALLGREFVDGNARTGLYRLARALARPDEPDDIAATLAGPGASPRGAMTVGGHTAIVAGGEFAGRRSVALGWECPVLGRALFVVASAPSSGAPPAGVMARDLAARYPCRHP